MRTLVPVIMSLVLPVVGFADDATSAARAALAERLEGVEASQIAATPVPGLFEVRVGPNLLYVTGDGRYLLRGQLVDLEDQANLTQERRIPARVAWLSELDESTMVVFEPQGEVAHTITVFTDTECGFCRRFHAEIDRYLAQGIRVRYIAHPILGEASIEQAEAVWCAADRQQAMNRAKAGQRLRRMSCDRAPIHLHLGWARDAGVQGTPAFFTDNGGFISGYVPVERLLAEIEEAALDARVQR